MNRAERRQLLRQPHMKILARAIDAGALSLRPGSVAVVTVRHDDHCPRLRGGACQCDPDLEAEYPRLEVNR